MSDNAPYKYTDNKMMEKRNVEMVEMKDQGDLKKGESGDKSNEEQETSIVAVPNL